MHKNGFLLFYFSFVIGVEIEFLPYTNPPPSSRAFPLMESYPSYDIILIYSGNSNPTTIYSDIWLFNTTLLQWERLFPSNEDIPVARYNGGSFISESNRLFYIFGGISLAGPINDLWSFQADGFLWTKIETYGDIPLPRMRFGYTSYNDDYGNLQFAIFGGITGYGTDSNLFILNTTTWTWTEVKASGDLPPAIEGPSLAYYKKRLYLAGGYATYLKNPNIQTFFYYDLSSNEWVNITSSQSYVPRLHQGNFIYNDEFYLMAGYSLSLGSLDISWYKVSLIGPNYNWVKIEITSDDADSIKQDSYGFAIAGDTVYQFGGNKTPKPTNRLAIFNLKNSPICAQVIAENLSPSPRMHHSLLQVGNYLYTFGGRGDYNELLNDLWEFEPENDYWQLKVPTGDVPSKRHSYAAASEGDHMLIWGGIGQGGYLNDGYLYNINTNLWNSLTYTGINPSPRLGACIGLQGENVYIYGGLTDSGLSDELWLYSINSKTYTLLDHANSYGPGPIFYPTCSLFSSSPVLYIIYGESDNNIPANKIYGYNINTGKWKLYYDGSEDTEHSKSRAAIYKTPNITIFAGGESQGTYPNNEILIYSSYYKEWESLGFLPYTAIAPASIYYQDYFYIYGGGTAEDTLIRFSIPSNKFIRLSLASLCSNGTCPFTCSPGTYMTSNGCKVCTPGYYSDEFGLNNCLACPKGKYNPNYGGTTLGMCYPCQEGQFNDKEGQERCLDCPGGATCNIGSLNYEYKITDYNDSYIQPPIYKSSISETSQNNLITGIVVGTAGFLIIASLSIIKENRKYLLFFDLYMSLHNYVKKQIMTVRKTKIGGVYGLAFLFIAIAIIEIAFVNYLEKNIYETKSLVPFVVLAQDVSKFEGNFVIIVTFMNYGGKCIDYDEDKNIICPSSISLTIEGITGRWSEQSCSLMSNGDCLITISCAKCSISTQGNIYYTMDDSTGYTSGFTANITSSSSIPGKLSSYETTVLPDSNSLFFGGTTTIYYDMISSYYEDTVNNNNDTGYHVDIDKIPNKGLQYQSFELGYAFINYLKLQLDVDGNGLTTKKWATQTFTVLISALLGSVFAVLGIVGGAMRQTESSRIKIKKIMDHTKLVKETKKNANNIFTGYGRWQKHGYDGNESSEEFDEFEDRK
ncbi:unnamed protein product [Blepharisma stoltei]|uniref:Tyrosine-protein kinase ephrin type A/B receptor-like domain-containing protein n=1 Tax=Blepharisma stoltei TaxID=1481888 RepID=A0AAU9J2N8_9CILI|nr:unnamed protein product [Blepharisma stoltei]